MTEMAGVEAGFNECLKEAKKCDINGIMVPVLHISHLIENKKSVGRPKDQLDVIYLEKIKKLRDEEG